MIRAQLQREPSIDVCVHVATYAGENFNINSRSIQNSFQAWLRDIAPAAVEQRPAVATPASAVATAAVATPARRSLTTQERTAVSLATVRESASHRRWPREIIEKFAAAEVVAYRQPAFVELTSLARRFHLLRPSGESCAAPASTLWR